MATISTLDELTAHYPTPATRVRSKKRPSLDDGTRALVESSPFVLLATAGADGTCDVSPRGGPPGFVKVLDERHLAIPDLNGNHLIDSLRNIVDNGHAGLLVVLPGQDETLRIDGAAWLTTDDDVLDRFVEEVRRPPLAVVIRIHHVFTHCAKAFRRGGVWQPTTWRTYEHSPVLAARQRQLIDDGLTDDPIEQYVATSCDQIEADLAMDRPT
ncbi:MAG: MSMEG_1061 family FMN-dependent PPOX-type flavoprotein [Actinomycetes bacterium]